MKDLKSEESEVCTSLTFQADYCHESNFKLQTGKYVSSEAYNCHITQ